MENIIMNELNIIDSYFVNRTIKIFKILCYCFLGNKKFTTVQTLQFVLFLQDQLI